MKNHCEICGSKSHGLHFGAVTCRACAAFFKRALLAKRNRSNCKYENKCEDFNGSQICKTCRLRKCVRVGMNSRTLQAMPILKYLPLEFQFPHSEIFIKKSSGKRTTVNLNPLISQAYDLLNLGSPAPWSQNLTSLQKMSHANRPSEIPTCSKLDIICMGSVSTFWRHDFLSTARWLCCFEKFEKLPRGIKMQLLQSIWHVWARLNKIIKSAELRKRQGYKSRNLQVTEKFYVEFDNVIVDTSWISRHPIEQIRCFMDVSDTDWKLEPFIQKVSELNLTKTEISYMTAQLCFQYAANRFVGSEISEICENFLEIIGNDLHLYYMEGFGEVKNYAGRLSLMLKINNGILTSIRELREKIKIAHVFDIFIADFSHPEMFVDAGC